jgi:hypothetical protein
MQTMQNFQTQFNEKIKPNLQRIYSTLKLGNEHESIKQFRDLFQIIRNFARNYKGSDSTDFVDHIRGYMPSGNIQKKQIDRDELFDEVKHDVAKVLRGNNANEFPYYLGKITSIYGKLKNLRELDVFERDLVALFTPKIKEIGDTLYSDDENTVRACIQKIRKLFIGIDNFIIDRNRLDYREYMIDPKLQHLYHGHRKTNQMLKPRELVKGVKDDLAFILRLIKFQQPDNILQRLSLVLRKLVSIEKLYDIYKQPPMRFATRCSSCAKLISM